MKLMRKIALREAEQALEVWPFIQTQNEIQKIETLSYMQQTWSRKMELFLQPEVKKLQTEHETITRNHTKP